MAFSDTPKDWLGDGYSSDGTDMTIPIAGIPGLTGGEANAATGDIRKIIFALCEALNARYAALPLADRPVKMSIVKTSGALVGANVNVGFTFNFNLAVSGMDVADEA